MMGKTHLAGGVALAIVAEVASQKMGFTLFDSVIAPSATSVPTVMVAVGVAGVASFHYYRTSITLNQPPLI